MLEVRFTGIFKDSEELFQDFIKRNDNLILIDIDLEKEESKNLLGIKIEKI